MMAVGWIVAFGVLAGCGDLGSSGAEVRVYLQNTGGPGDGGPVTDAMGLMGFAGEVDVRVVALIQDEGGFWTDVTSTAQELTFTLGEDSGRVELGRRSLAPGAYSRARLIFTRVEVQLTDAPPGFSMPADGTVRVQLGSGDRVPVTRNATMILTGDETVEVTFDLGVETWLPGAIDGVVGTTLFSSAVSIQVN
ncbi:MAG: hypothetical protein EA351_12455 [Gemmatimonadales bacterium]|nr:MAG: hypothetical protein EA351_12455 [Gemmatimonadales bacterium]